MNRALLVASPLRSGPPAGPELSPADVLTALAGGWRGVDDSWVLDTTVLNDGGPGFTEALSGPWGLDTVPVVGTGADGQLRPLTFAVSAASATAVIEAATIGPPDQDITVGTTAGVADLLVVARDLGVRRCVIGVGGMRAHDGGAGLLAQLLGGPPGAGFTALPSLIDDWSGTDIIIGVNTSAPLLGLSGASAERARRKGIGDAEAQKLERRSGELADAIVAGSVGATGPADPALRRAMTAAPGSGAGGGLAFALAALGGTIVAGAQVTADAVDLDRMIPGAGVIVVVQRSADWTSLHDDVAAVVTAAAQRHGVPVVLVAPDVRSDRRALQRAGIAMSYSLASEHDRLLGRASDVGTLTTALADVGARVARGWASAG